MAVDRHAQRGLLDPFLEGFVAQRLSAVIGHVAQDVGEAARRARAFGAGWRGERHGHGAVDLHRIVVRALLRAQ